MDPEPDQPRLDRTQADIEGGSADGQGDGWVDEYEAPQPIEVDSSHVIEAARRKHGRGGAMLAAGMFGLDLALTNKKKPESVQVQEASGEPEDVDATGISMTIDDSTVVASPALERRDPLVLKRRSRRR